MIISQIQFYIWTKFYHTWETDKKSSNIWCLKDMLLKRYVLMHLIAEAQRHTCKTPCFQLSFYGMPYAINKV